MARVSAVLRRQLGFFAVATGLLIAALIGLWLMAGNGDLGSPSTKFSLGLNLVAAVIYGAVFAAASSWVVNQNHRDLIESTIRHELAKGRTEITQLAPSYLPNATYPATAGFDDDFNGDLMKSISGSQKYIFYGTSGRFVAARLRRLVTCPEDITVIMMDPRAVSGLSRRAAERVKWRSEHGKTQADIAEKLRQELIATVVDLFDFRSVAKVRIVYANDTAVSRYEITDDALYYSWYRGSPGKEMPQTVRFGPEALMYKVVVQDLTRICELQQASQIIFLPATTDQDLVAHIQLLDVGIQVDKEYIQKARSRAHGSTQGLSSYLDDLAQREQAAWRP